DSGSAATLFGPGDCLRRREKLVPGEYRADFRAPRIGAPLPLRVRHHVAHFGANLLRRIGKPDRVAIGFGHAAAIEPGKARRLSQQITRLSQDFFSSKEVLREPGYLLTEPPRLPGLDGRRMAKSYGNAIWLTDPPEEIRTKVRNMMTDPQRQRRTD